MFEVKGVIKAVETARRQVEIRHEAVPGFMPPMTMPFDVKDTNELAGLAPGQRVTFRLMVENNEAWIDHIKRVDAVSTGVAPTPPPAETPTTRLARDVEPLAPGDMLPDYQLTNQLGRAFSTRDFKGQALALTFLFTRCPYPTFCPRMASEFEATQQQLLKGRPALTNWHLLTVSFDPEYDKPEVLKMYAEAHAYDPRYWTFATGALIDVTALGEQFGLAFWRDPGGAINHNLRTAVIDAAGRVQKIFEGNTWKSDELARELVLAAGKR